MSEEITKKEETPVEKPKTETPVEKPKEKEEKKNWIGGHTMDKEPVG